MKFEELINALENSPELSSKGCNRMAANLQGYLKKARFCRATTEYEDDEAEKTVKRLFEIVLNIYDKHETGKDFAGCLSNFGRELEALKGSIDGRSSIINGRIEALAAAGLSDARCLEVQSDNIRRHEEKLDIQANINKDVISQLTELEDEINIQKRMLQIALEEYMRNK